MFFADGFAEKRVFLCSLANLCILCCFGNIVWAQLFLVLVVNNLWGGGPLSAAVAHRRNAKRIFVFFFLFFSSDLQLSGAVSVLH